VSVLPLLSVCEVIRYAPGILGVSLTDELQPAANTIMIRNIKFFITLGFNVELMKDTISKNDLAL
jgi:hypothetical protein